MRPDDTPADRVENFTDVINAMNYNAIIEISYSIGGVFVSAALIICAVRIAMVMIRLFRRSV